MVPSGTINGSYQGGSFQISYSSVASGPCVKCNVSSATGTHHKSLGSNQGQQKWPIVFESPLENFDQQLKTRTIMNGVGVCAR